MNSEFLPAAAFITLGVLVLVVIVAVLRHKAQQRIEALSPAFELGTAGPAGAFSNGVVGLYQGFECHYSVQYPSQYDRGGATLQIAAVSTHQWGAERSSGGTRLMVKVGLMQDLEIGDRDLDDHLRFSGENESDLRTIFAVERVRDAMHVLVATENFQSVHFRKERADIKWSPRDPKIDDDPEGLRLRLEAATNLASSCNATPIMGI